MIYSYQIKISDIKEKKPHQALKMECNTLMRNQMIHRAPKLRFTVCIVLFFTTFC